MTASPAEARAVLESCIHAWLSDRESAVVYAEEVEGRWAVRLRQETRDFTTVWFEPGARSLRFEAYVLPLPPDPPAELLLECLRRNAGSWRVHFAVDRDHGLLIRGRLANGLVTASELSYVLAEIYDTVETSFRSLLRSGYGR